VPDFRLSPRSKRDLRSSGVLCSAERCPVTSYPFGSIGPIFRDPLKMGPIGYPETSVRNCHYSLGSDTAERRSQNVTQFHTTSGNVSSCIVMYGLKQNRPFSAVESTVVTAGTFVCRDSLHCPHGMSCTYIHTYIHTCTVHTHTHMYTHCVCVATSLLINPYYVVGQHFPICVFG
jgi:hypothetical protein